MLHVEVIPCLTDNYAYLIINDKKHCVLVDVPEAAPIVQRINDQGLKLEAVLLTHHHSDHVAGLDDMDVGRAPIFGALADRERMPPLSVRVKPGQHFKEEHLRMEVLAADGHTSGHVAYYLPEANALFSGDSLMFWGCGRLFEGTPAQMWDTLERFSKLPPDTLIYSGHNYGVINGRFAISLGGYLDRMEARMKRVEDLNAKNIPVCPVTLKEELETNPFLLAFDDAYAKEIGLENMTPPERFAHIRKLKDNF